jgi:hypothetical protein
MADSPRALKKWFAERGRKIQSIHPAKIIFSREETWDEFMKRLERIAVARQKRKAKKTL